MTDEDDLRARLRRADPAAGLPPYDSAPLLENTMTTATTDPVRRTTPLVAVAAALVLIAAVGAWVLLRPEPVPTVTALTAPGVAAKCAEPSADRLREAADFAFAGTV